MQSTDWSPHIEAAAEAIYGRLRITRDDAPDWDDLDIDAADHYCIAAKKAIDAFHRSATRDILSGTT